MNYLNLYVNFLKSFLKPKKRLKVVFDCSNGPTGLVVRPLFKRNKFLKAFFLNSKPDGRFPSHSPNPLDRGVKRDLIKHVFKERADLGVIFDGDGDRALFVDNLGREIPTDAVARLLISYLKPRKVVLDTTTGFLTRDKRGLGDFLIFNSPVGGYFIKKAMKREGADFGAERSGHYYFKKLHYFDSGVLSAILVIDAVSLLKKKNKTLAEWIDSLPRRYSIEEYNIRSGNAEKAIMKLKQKFPRREGQLSFTDGITLRKKDFWINVRGSKTQPFIRVNAESKSEKVLKDELAKLVRLLPEIKMRSTIHK